MSTRIWLNNILPRKLQQSMLVSEPDKQQLNLWTQQSCCRLFVTLIESTLILCWKSPAFYIAAALVNIFGIIQILFMWSAPVFPYFLISQWCCYTTNMITIAVWKTIFYWRSLLMLVACVIMIEQIRLQNIIVDFLVEWLWLVKYHQFIHVLMWSNISHLLYIL